MRQGCGTFCCPIQSHILLLLLRFVISYLAPSLSLSGAPSDRVRLFWVWLGLPLIDEEDFRVGGSCRQRIWECLVQNRSWQLLRMNPYFGSSLQFFNHVFCLHIWCSGGPWILIHHQLRQQRQTREAENLCIMISSLPKALAYMMNSQQCGRAHQ